MRFIPACVGNSPVQVRISTALPVHPRVCGELDQIQPFGGVDYGSSPRVWGTPPAAAQTREDYRFIPACVGNSLVISAIRPVSPVHPRVCGELDGCLARYPAPLRFIPACVGNSLPFTRQETAKRLQYWLVLEKTHLPRDYSLPLTGYLGP